MESTGQIARCRLLILDDEELFRQAAALFADIARKAVDRKGVFYVALSGGSTPKKLYSLLAERYKDSIPWSDTQIFFGDERCVPPDDPESNYRMINEALLSKTDIPTSNIHRMKGEVNPHTAAAEYECELAKAFHLTGDEIPEFDLMLLGMGEEGHTASIFPGSGALFDETRLTVPNYVEKLDSYRLTLTPPVIKNAGHIVVLVTGEKKADALKHALSDAYNPKSYPIQIVRHTKGRVTWMVDPSAAAYIKDTADVCAFC